VIFVSNWGNQGIQAILNKTTLTIPFGPLDGGIMSNGLRLSVQYSCAWLGAAGTAILLAAVLSGVLLRLPLKVFLETALQTLRELWKPLVTIGSIVGFAFVANFSGMSVAIGNALTMTGRFFPLLSPLLGWFGVFITGSDTSSNALFSSIQSQTASSIGVSPVLTVAANSSGGVAAKMISPQSVAVATAATGQTGEEGRLFRFTILHSLGLVAIICLITFAQAYDLPWMIPAAVSAAAAAGNSLDIGGSILIVVSALAVLFLAFAGRRRAYDILGA
ncbi:MAG: L-lactate permease, partial [Patescibacteria group bacterium]|nr:L-lactate permease [Patescibacteria group bacterium]